MPGDPEAGIPPGAETARAVEVATPEKTEEEQKIEALVNQVREVNAQLGGKVATEVSFDDGRSILFFARTVHQPGEPLFPYGVDSIHGPVVGTGELALKLLPDGHNYTVDLPQAASVTKDEVLTYIHPVSDESRLTIWSKAFEASKAAVLRDQKEMQQIREAKNRILDQASSVVSKPIDLSTPPSTPTSG